MVKRFKSVYRSLKSRLRKLRFLRASRAAGPGPKIFYLMGLGDYFPNLGDQAQAAAIPLWIRKHFALPVLEIKTEELDDLLPMLQRHIARDDIVFLHSGGNFGDDWYETQLIRERIMAALPGNRLIQLPQTVHYSATEQGLARLAQSRRVIDTHASLMLVGRDRQSEALCRQYFPRATVSAQPDMVLSMQQLAEKELGSKITQRAPKICKVLMILRNDKEGLFDATVKETLSAYLNAAGYETQLWDTDVKDYFPDGFKFWTIRRYLDFIAGFDAVVTDRYHGLIFSVLVKRPCVVLKTHNHKLTSAFDWFDEVNFAVRADTDAEIVAALTGLEALDEYRSPDWNAKHFDPMAADVQAFLDATKQTA